MKAARLKATGQVELVDEPVPEPGPGESLVRVGTVGLCGSDLHWFGQGAIGDAVLSRPLVLGHEFGGTVEGGRLHGRRVAVDPAQPCGTCPRCRQGNANLCPQVRFAGHGSTDGGLREYIAWPTELLFPVPDSFSDSIIALLEPLGVALHAWDLGHVRMGGTVAVVGCGPIGLMIAQVAKASGAALVVGVEPLPHRRSAALDCGATVVASPEDMKAAQVVSGGQEVKDSIDVAFEVAGTDEAIEEAMTLVRPGGRVVLVGIPDDDRTSFPAALARRKGLTIAMARRMKDAYPRAIDLVARGVVDVEPLVSHSFVLAEAPRAFELAARRDGLKTVVRVGSA
jgi:L-iditol 2-dehydrogenase